MAFHIAQPSKINSEAGFPTEPQISHPALIMVKAPLANGGSTNLRAANTALALSLISLISPSIVHKSPTMVLTSLVALQAVLMKSLLEVQLAGAVGVD